MEGHILLINRTYVETTEESAEDGEFSDTGFLAQREGVTFRELVKYLQDCVYSSQWPNNGSRDVWYSTSADRDFMDGTDRQESIHFHRDNPPQYDKYWKWAAKFAGLLK